MKVNDLSLFHNNSDKNKFGYYTVGNFKSYSKLAAYEISQRVHKDVNWYFNDDVFSLYDWTKEPDLGLEDLYKIRAEQIREKYDYLVLWYSGGSDSHNIAEVFRRNNIHLDELAIYITSAGKTSINPDEPINAEPYKVAYPYTEFYKQHSPSTFINFFDMYPLVTRCYSDSNFVSNLPYLINCIGGVHHATKSYIREFSDHYKKLIDAGKKVCFIWGCDKPRVSCENNKWSFDFCDMIDGSVRSHTQMMNSEVEFDECFYWSPDLPELSIKQAHVIKNFYSTDIGKQSLVDDNKLLEEIYKIHGHGQLTKSSIDFMKNKIHGYMPRADGIRKLVYPYWDLNTYTIGKSWTGDIFSVRDAWVFNSNEHNIKSNYFGSISKLTASLVDERAFIVYKEVPDFSKELIKNVGRDLNTSSTKLPSILKGFTSRKYYLN